MRCEMVKYAPLCTCKSLKHAFHSASRMLQCKTFSNKTFLWFAKPCSANFTASKVITSATFPPHKSIANFLPRLNNNKPNPKSSSRSTPADRCLASSQHTRQSAAKIMCIHHLIQAIIFNLSPRRNFTVTDAVFSDVCAVCISRPRFRENKFLFVS